MSAPAPAAPPPSTPEDACPHMNMKQAQPSSATAPPSPLTCDGCPMEGVDASINDMPTGNQRQPGQTYDLSTRRAVSHIDKTDFTPYHQVDGVGRWVYPSEQQYYNAMKRKGYNPDIKDVSVILAIHNTVNEESWGRIREWEAKYTSTPKLKRFMGRPKDLSPKAWLLSSLLGYSKPFDRHDWIVDRDGQEVRYVIDFYRGKAVQVQVPEGQQQGGKAADPRGPVQMQEAAMSMYLDVRPALDSYGALRDRVQVLARDALTVLRRRFGI